MYMRSKQRKKFDYLTTHLA